MMLPRIISRSSNSARLLQTLILPKSQSSSFLSPYLQSSSDSKPSSYYHRFFSSNNHNAGGGGRSSDFWNLSAEETADKIGSLFQQDAAGAGAGSRSGEDGFGFKPWSLTLDEEKKESDVFDVGDGGVPGVDGFKTQQQEQQQSDVDRRLEEQVKLETEKKRLEAVLEGPDRAFGDLVAESGITDDMLDSLIALKDFSGIEGLPPLKDIEDWRYEKTTRKSTRSEIERQKQEDIAKARVRMVDDQGRAYGTGRRKTSVACVWIQPGDGKFVVNDREFDVYFPMIDQRAALLRPLTETKTLGLWNVKCTVKGGGTTGQVGAVRLGISRALQNWEPGLRPALKEAGFLRRDPRAVERKKPGKAKARKSFQWVKR